MNFTQEIERLKVTGYCPTIVTSPRHVYQKLLPLLYRSCFVLDNNQIALLSPVVKKSFEKGLTSDWSQFFWSVKVKVPLCFFNMENLLTHLWELLGDENWRESESEFCPGEMEAPKVLPCLAFISRFLFFYPLCTRSKSDNSCPMDDWLQLVQPAHFPLFLSGTSAEQSTPGRSQASHRIQNLLPWQSFNSSFFL